MIDLDTLRAKIDARALTVHTALTGLEAMQSEAAQLTRILADLDQGHIALSNLGYCAKLAEMTVSQDFVPPEPTPKRPRLAQDQPGSLTYSQGESAWAIHGEQAQNPYADGSLRAKGWKLGWEAARIAAFVAAIPPSPASEASDQASSDTAEAAGEKSPAVGGGPEPWGPHDDPRPTWLKLRPTPGAMPKATTAVLASEGDAA